MTSATAFPDFRFEQHLSNPLPLQDPSIGDVILCTSDGTQFHVHIAVLGAQVRHIQYPRPSLSPNFKPTVFVPESGAVWALILQMIHPGLEYPNVTLSDIRVLIAPARKYAISPVLLELPYALRRPYHLDAQPLACSASLPDVARAAARRTLRLPSCPVPPGTGGTEAGRAAARLLSYRTRCAAAAVALVSPDAYGVFFTREDRPGSVTRALPAPCGRSGCAARSAWMCVRVAGSEPGVARTFAFVLGYLRALEAELTARPDPGGAVGESVVWGMEEAALAVIMACAECGKEAQRCRAFAEEIERQLEVAVSRVHLHTGPA
ncbi:uncharacterized protein BXZ73DRAFT_106320 [Epithele typhae]|uniref:uncharacterized protein n=1 Tax=Epithele typhae TaxID=378194 RepID=UPI002008CE0D|nr:uncharacterized protein BXZ73DRAFT_106320 [Epithele typhae]KAH9915192.1 hypothetical protein BXZ73DRAFT_106320 [Epithele typhae]